MGSTMDYSNLATLHAAQNDLRRPVDPKSTPALLKVHYAIFDCSNKQFADLEAKAVIHRAIHLDPINSSAATDIDKAVIGRIKKCLDRARHPSTSENEVKAALCLASRLTNQFNVHQADVLAHESPQEQQQKGGRSVVSIVRGDGNLDKPVRENIYVSRLTSAINCFFDTKSYLRTAIISIDITFYGIAENSTTASLAFEMVYNLMTEWARRFKTTSNKNSYCLGICEELITTARKEKGKEEEQASVQDRLAFEAMIHADTLERQAELDRLHNQQSFSNDESSDKVPSFPALHGIDFENTGIKQEPHEDTELTMIFSSIKEEDEKRNGMMEKCNASYISHESSSDAEDNFDVKGSETNALDEADMTDLTKDNDEVMDGMARASPVVDQSTFGSKAGLKRMMQPSQQPQRVLHTQLILYRKTASDIADEYLKQQNIRLHTSRKRAVSKINIDSFNEGLRDGKEINVRLKQIQH